MPQPKTEPRPQHQLKDYKTEVHNDWCPGCGDFGILSAMQQALFELQRPPHEVTIVSGVGCSSKTPHFIGTYGFHTLHGRGLPVAAGLRLANHRQTVIAVGGDGDGYGIGAAHFIAAGRRNLDFTYIVFNNAVYGLTKGQSSPTLKKGLKTKSMAERSITEGLNPIALAVSAGFTFVASSYSLNVRHMKELIKKAIDHKGSAFLDVYQTCPSYNDIHTKEWFAGKDRSNAPRLYDINEKGYDPDVKDPEDDAAKARKKGEAIAKSFEASDDGWPMGVFYRCLEPTYEDYLAERMPLLRERPLVECDAAGRPVDALIDE
ncbi:MAG: thiamine pyrophosphate-dependent enzyme, partial [Planctomycetota bacterium]